MEREFKTIAIVGAGASGCICAYHLINSGYNVTIFDNGLPLRTLIPTGGGRCNLAHAEFDLKELASNYPRGEKFLYSVFSRFSTSDTLEMFENMGIETYFQENGRIFPKSNSSKEVRNTILQKIQKANFIKERVLNIKKLENGFNLKTQKAEYFFDTVILAIGGHSGLNIAKGLGLKTIEQYPSLVGLNTVQNLAELQGLVIKNCVCENSLGDILFTHFGVSGPLIYTLSSIKAFERFPYKLTIDTCTELNNLQDDLNNSPHKEIKNILAKYLPERFVNYILRDFDKSLKGHQINGKFRDTILNRIHNFEIEITGTNAGEETVTAGGIDLNEINPKTMQCKNISNLYCIGEVLNIDGFCGGFNLQNAWSTAYVAAMGIIDNT